MALEIVTIPCRTDNYAYLLHDGVTDTTALVDAPETAPIRDALEARGWGLQDLLITHHHDDHVEGVEALREVYGCRVIGAKADEHRLPPLDYAVEDGDVFGTVGEDAHVLDVSGHTVGHVAFHFPGAQAVFTADSLMALGCGRVFEGTMPQMWESLKKLRALPDETLVYSGHEYTQKNARFALTIEPENRALISRSEAIEAARAEGRPTVPSKLSEEKATNPLLRADLPELQAAIGMEGAAPEEVFAEVRGRRDGF